MGMIQLREILAKGLRKESSTPASALELIECQNVRVGTNGLEAYTFPYILAAQEVPVIPFPQLIKGMQYTLLMHSTHMQVADPSDWTLTNVSVWDWTTEDPATFAATQQWHFADMGSNFILTDGTTLIFMQSFSSTKDTAAIWAVSNRSINSVCYHRGRVLFGGFDANDSQYLYTGKGPSWVAWSCIGGGDVFAHVVVDALDAALADQMEDPSGEQMILRNDAGAMPMPLACTVLALKPMGSRVIVYTDRAIYALVLASAQATYGLQELVQVGAYSREAVGGDEQQQFFVDKRGELWTITADSIQRLGYREFIGPWVGTNDHVILSFDAQKRDLYISGELACYLLTQQGMSYLTHPIYSLYYTETGAIATGGSGAIQDGASVKTSLSNLGNLHYKTIRGVEVDVESATTHEITLGINPPLIYATQVSEPVVDGFAAIQASTMEVQVELTSAAFVPTSISDIRLNVDDRILAL